MTQKEVFNLLEENKNERGIANWKQIQETERSKMDSYGIGLTQLKKIAKQIGRNHDLSLELWDTNVYDAKIMATLIDEPKKVTREQVEKQVADINYWMMSHSYCGSLLCKTKFAKELSDEWRTDKDATKRRCAYLLLYHNKGNKNSTDDYLEDILRTIEKDLPTEENFVKDAMNNALWAIGQLNAKLHKQALAIAQKIGKVEVDYGANSCEAVDVVKHLSSDRIKKKLGVL